MQWLDECRDVECRVYGAKFSKLHFHWQLLKHVPATTGRGSTTSSRQRAEIAPAMWKICLARSNMGAMAVTLSAPTDL